MALDWSHAEKTYIEHHKASPRKEEKRTAKKHLTARRGVGSEEDGVHVAGNCNHAYIYHGAAQDPVESFDRWPMLPASRRA